MKKDLSPAAMVGILGAVVVVVALGLFIGLRDPAPSSKPANSGAAAHAIPPPADGPMPEEFKAKLRDAESAQGK